VLTLREGELDSRLRDRDRTIEELNLRLRELTGTLRKEQATRELLSRRIDDLQSTRALSRIPKRLLRSARRPKRPKLRPNARKRAAILITP
jgi:hypothetical protein